MAQATIMQTIDKSIPHQLIPKLIMRCLKGRIRSLISMVGLQNS